MSIHPSDQLSSSVHNDSINKTLQKRFERHLLPADSAVDQIFEVTLIKDAEVGIGITIVGSDNDNSRVNGIFIRSVSSDGSAAKSDPPIKTGDRILTINDQSLNGLPHHNVVQLIRDSGSKVKLKISRIPAPGSLKKNICDATPIKFPADSVHIYSNGVDSQGEGHLLSSMAADDDSCIVPRINLSYLFDDVENSLSDNVSDSSNDGSPREHIPYGQNVVNDNSSSWADLSAHGDGQKAEAVILSSNDGSDSEGDHQDDVHCNPDNCENNTCLLITEDPPDPDSRTHETVTSIPQSENDSYLHITEDHADQDSQIHTMGTSISQSDDMLLESDVLPDSNGIQDSDSLSHEEDLTWSNLGDTTLDISETQVYSQKLCAISDSEIDMATLQLTSKNSVQVEPPSHHSNNLEVGDDTIAFDEGISLFISEDDDDDDDDDDESVRGSVHLNTEQSKDSDVDSQNDDSFGCDLVSCDKKSSIDCDTALVSCDRKSVSPDQSYSDSNDSVFEHSDQEKYDLHGDDDCHISDSCTSESDVQDVSVPVICDPGVDTCHSEQDDLKDTVESPFSHDGYECEETGDTDTGASDEGPMEDPTLSYGQTHEDKTLIIKENDEDVTAEAGHVIASNDHMTNEIDEKSKSLRCSQSETESHGDPTFSCPSCVINSSGDEAPQETKVTRQSPLIIITDTDGQDEHALESVDIAPIAYWNSDDEIPHIEECEESILTEKSKASPDNIEDIEYDIQDNNVVTLMLEKDSEGRLGFSLVTAEVGDQIGVFIKTIKEESVAHQDGRLKVGDRLIQINRTSLIGYNHRRAISVLQELDEPVKLTVTRCISAEDEDLSFTTHANCLSESLYVKDADTSFSGAIQTDIPDTSYRDISQTIPELSYLASATDLSFLESVPEESIEESMMSDIEQYILDDTRDSVSRFSMEPYGGSENDYSSQISECNNNYGALQKWLSYVPLMNLPPEDEAIHRNTLVTLQTKLECGQALEEFEDLYNVRCNDDCEAAKLIDNKAKNRYRNVLPYDYNRVQLSGAESYINASHIVMEVGGATINYITCQGPLPHTAEDFWTMVLEQNSNVIAMMTQVIEDDRVKCHQYWPASKDSIYITENGLYEVSLVTENITEDFSVRHLQVKNNSQSSGEKWSVVHLNYTSWMDHGAPMTATSLLQFLQLIRATHRSGPIITHCSAGIGRTGMHLAMDVAVRHLEQSLQVDMFDIAYRLRKQRQGMIQTKSQYVFCYQACIEGLKSVMKR